MKKTALLLIIISLFASCKLQKTNVKEETTNNESNKKEVKVDYLKYFDLIGEASNYYNSKHYKESGLKYDEAFKVLNGKSDTSDRYKASCSYALANNKDRAFFHLFYIANNDEYTKLEHLKNEVDLVSLHKDKRWEKLLLIVKKNKEVIEKDFNQELINKLDTIYQNDQNCRIELGFKEKKYGIDSDEVKKSRKKCISLDSINQIKVSKILDKNGWLGKDIVGERGNITLFLVLQHSDNNINMQLKYLPLLEKAVKNGKANPTHLAMLQDRVNLKQGKKQIYGSQIYQDKETGEYYVAPLIEPESVDKRRAEVGLSPLADYVQNWKIEWDVEKHKKRIAKMENK